VIGREDLALDPTLADGDARWAREAELDAAITAWTTQQTVNGAVAVLGEAGVPAGPVHDARGIAADPHFQAREMLRPLRIAIDGEPESIRFPGVVPKIPGAPGEVRWPGPKLGEHTDEVLSRLLGLDAGRLADLRSRGVV
jgi:formyl-CoA transferase